MKENLFVLILDHAAFCLFVCFWYGLLIKNGFNTFSLFFKITYIIFFIEMEFLWYNEEK